jgi:hypothetical protein
MFFLPVFFSLWSFRQLHYGLAELRFRDGMRMFIFVRELRTDASLLSLIASGFSTLAVRIANQLFTPAGQPCKTDPLVQTQYLNKIIHDLI